MRAQVASSSHMHMHRTQDSGLGPRSPPSALTCWPPRMSSISLPAVSIHPELLRTPPHASPGHTRARSDAPPPMNPSKQLSSFRAFRPVSPSPLSHNVPFEPFESIVTTLPPSPADTRLRAGVPNPALSLLAPPFSRHAPPAARPGGFTARRLSRPSGGHTACPCAIPATAGALYCTAALSDCHR